MNKERIKVLEQFCDDHPSDPFNYYALALEYQLADQKKAEELFKKILSEFPDYLPVYYQAVDFFSNQNQLHLAIDIAKKGIEKAKELNQLKTLSEIRSLLESIE
jgi:tetratricopeptide (TPR) repeat protein